MRGQQAGVDATPRARRIDRLRTDHRARAQRVRTRARRADALTRPGVRHEFVAAVEELCLADAEQLSAADDRHDDRRDANRTSHLTSVSNPRLRQCRDPLQRVRAKRRYSAQTYWQ